MSRRTDITVTDQFCGAGGSSSGARKAGAVVRLALNHWDRAIETHQTNFPEAIHDCTDISASDPRRYPATDILITSPECTNHSVANGKRKPTAQLDMFEESLPDAAAERSRATMWDVPRFAERHNYRAIITENVVDARRWVMWDAWIHAMTLLGYDYKCVYFNSMHAHPTPQSRDRMYVVFWKKGNKAPNLDIHPKAHCKKCGCDVDSVQSWKSGKTFGKFGERLQYVYCCPKCASVVRPYYYAAWNVIDWSVPITRIGDRKTPLKPKTIDRIKAGLKKFGRPDPTIYDMKGDHPLRGLEEPTSTMVATAIQQWLVAPYLVETQFTHSGANRVAPLTDALTTQTAQQSKALVVPPFITSYYGSGGESSLDAGLPTLTTKDRHTLVVPPFFTNYYGNGEGQVPATDPLHTMTTKDQTGLLAPPPFIVNMQTNSLPTAMTDALQTLLTGSHRYLAMPKTIEVEDCGFRMLEPHECQRAMAFPDEYVVTGTRRERVRQLGNAVTPPVMEILMERVMETFR